MIPPHPSGFRPCEPCISLVVARDHTYSIYIYIYTDGFSRLHPRARGLPAALPSAANPLPAYTIIASSGFDAVWYRAADCVYVYTNLYTGLPMTVCALYYLSV